MAMSQVPDTPPDEAGRQPEGAILLGVASDEHGRHTHAHERHRHGKRPQRHQGAWTKPGTPQKRIEIIECIIHFLIHALLEYVECMNV